METKPIQLQANCCDSKQFSLFSVFGDMNVMHMFYYAAFTLFVIGNCAASTTSTNPFLPSLKLGCQIVAIAFLLLKVLFDRFGLKQLVLFAPISIAFAYSGYICSDYSLLWGWLFIVTGRDAKLVYLARIALFVFASSLMITVSLSLVGVIPNLVSFRGSHTYYAFGFTHINALGLCIYEIVIALMVLRYPNYSVGDYVYCIFSFFLILVATGSRTSMICVAAAFLMIVLVKSGFAFRHSRGLLLILKTLFVFEVLFSLCFLFADPTNGGVFGLIDKLFSNRVYYSHYYFQQAGIGLFGNNFDGFETLAAGGFYIDDIVIDNAYCHAILVNGLIPFLIMIALIYKCYCRFRTEGRFTVLAMAMALFSFVGLSECSALNFYTAYALLALTPVFFGTSFRVSDER